MQFHTFFYNVHITIVSDNIFFARLYDTKIGTPPEEVENEILHVQCWFIYSRYAK